MQKDEYLLVEKTETSNDVYFVFAGFANKAMYEFYNTLKDEPGTKVFIRDPYKMWFLGGISEEISSIEKLLQYLETLIDNDSRVICLGASAGGYASLFVGYKLNADYIYAFSPQTFFDRKTRKIYDEKRWEPFVQNLYSRFSGKEIKAYNLKNVLGTKIFGKTFVYYCKDFLEDVPHINSIRHVKGIEFCGANCDIHNVARFFKEEGHLQEKMRRDRNV